MKTLILFYLQSILSGLVRWLSGYSARLDLGSILRDHIKKPGSMQYICNPSAGELEQMDFWDPLAKQPSLAW